MNGIPFSEERIRRKKFFILLCGVGIFFLTSMAKVLIPATIFQDLLRLNMPVDRISALGAAFMYAYAASQLVMGCFSDRWGGVRILLIGGLLFALGTVTFPLLHNYYLMLIFRIITGFGAGTIFLGVAKLLGDLFPARFSFALGAVLLFSYLGPTVGTVPMVKLVELISWRPAMIAPGAAALLLLAVITMLMRGTVKPVSGGQTLEPLLAMIKNKYIWSISFASATVYGCYYSIAGQIGQKIFSDIFQLASSRAAFCIMILTIIVAANNMVVNLLLKLLHDRRKAVIVLGVIMSLAGAAVGYWAFGTGKWYWFMLSGVLTAFPAGFFAIFGTVAKELNPPRYMAMSVAFLNFMAFVFISLYQNITGAVLKRFAENAAVMTFPVEAYQSVYIFFAAGGTVSLLAALLTPETRDRQLQD